MFGRNKEKKETYYDIIKLRQQYLDETETSSNFVTFSDWCKKKNYDWKEMEAKETEEERHARFAVERAVNEAREKAALAVEVEEVKMAKEAKIKEKADYINEKLELTEKELLAELLWKLSEDGKLKLKREKEMDELDEVKWEIEQDEEDQQSDALKEIKKIAKEEQDSRKRGYRY